MGEAPRNFGSKDGCTFTQPRGGKSSTARRKIWPYATTTIASGASERRSEIASGLRKVGGWCTGMPAAMAACLTGGEVSEIHVRPDGLAG